MIIFPSSLPLTTCAIEKTVPLLKINSSGDMNVQLLNVQLVSVGGKSSAGMTGSIRVDRGRGIYVHQADMRGIDELKGGKWTEGSYWVATKWTGG